MIKPEIVQRAKANRVGVRIGHKRFGEPGNGNTAKADRPGHAAVTLVVKGAVVRPARFLRRRVKADVSEIKSRHPEICDAAIEIFVIDGVFIVPHAVIWPGHLIADKEDPVASRGRLVLSHRCARGCPSHDGRLHSHGLIKR